MVTTKENLTANLEHASQEHSKALAAFKSKTGDFDNLQAAAAAHQQAIDELHGFIRSEY